MFFLYRLVVSSLSAAPELERGRRTRGNCGKLGANGPINHGNCWCATLHDIKWNDEKILSSYFLCTKSCLSSLEEALANWSEKRQKNTTTTTTHRIHENLTWNSLWCLAESSQKESQEAAPCRHIHHTSSYWCNVNPGLINHGWH